MNKKDIFYMVIYLGTITILFLFSIAFTIIKFKAFLKVLSL